MGEISTLFVHKVVGVAATSSACGAAEQRDLFLSVGIDPQAPVDAKHMIADTDYYGLCERVAQAYGFGPSLSVHVGASMSCDDYGAFGLAWKSALSLRGSYDRAERYGRMLTTVSSYQLLRQDGRNYMTLNRAGERRLGLRLSNEQTLVAIAQISREVCQAHFRPDAVYFKHPPPSDISAHESWFECPVQFGADRDALEVSDQLLETPNRLGDQSISGFFDNHLEAELAKLKGDAGLAQRVRIQVSSALSEGLPLISDVAQRLGMSGRSLQRRLSERGYAYQDIVDSARRELAERLLCNTQYSLAEVAFLTGFAEQSTFSRAFKRWKGQTPRSYRLSVQPASRA